MTDLMIFRALVRLKKVMHSMLVELSAVVVDVAKLARDGLQWSFGAVIAVALYILWVLWQKWLDVEEFAARLSRFGAGANAKRPNPAERRSDAQTIQ